MVTTAEDLSRWLLARLGGGPLSPAVLRMLHAPSVVGTDDLPFPELQPMGYALGNAVYSYRGRRLHLHGGNQIGYASQVMVVPDAQVGVAVLTNAHASRLPIALALSLMDRLLGLEPAPWGERLGAPTPPPPPAPPAVPPTRPLQDYEGTFSHPAYGDLGLRVVDDALAPCFHGLDDEMALLHLGDDDLRLDFLTVPGFHVRGTFRSGAQGEVEAVALALDPELAPQVFARR